MKLDISLVSSFYDIPNEIHVLNLLFCNGLTTFHLRKDLENKHLGGKDIYSEEKIRSYIESIPACFRNRIIIHSHFHLIKEYGLKGAHFKKSYGYQDFLNENNLNDSHDYFNYKGFSIHSMDEISEHEDKFDYLFLSPIFDSISNKGYNSKFNLMRLKQFLHTQELQAKIIALGGMNNTKVLKVKELGFNGLSLLGYIWSSFEENGDIPKAVDKFKLIQKLNMANQMAD